MSRPAGPGGAAIRQRAERFATLRAAHRALARVVHPSQIESENKQARTVLVQLQELHVRAQRGEALGAADFARVDDLLEATSGRMRKLLSELDIADLRGIAPNLSDDSACDAHALVDLTLDGETGDDKTLRTLEYLVTLLSSEEREGRRLVVQEPSQLTPRLSETCAARATRGGMSALDAERFFSYSAMQLYGSDDLGQVRDNLRAFKEKLGDGILHPRVLAAAVAYNVAMWNQISGAIEGGRSIDHLAEDLLEEAARQEPVEARPGRDSWLASPAFERLGRALAARAAGEALGEGPAQRFALACPVESLRPAECAALQTTEESGPACLVRAAVILGFARRCTEPVAESLRELGLDPDGVLNRLPLNVADAITVEARRLFAESRYEEAFALSEAKTRHLGSLVGSGGAPNPLKAPAGGLRATRRIDRVWLSAALAALFLIVAIPILPGLFEGSAPTSFRLSSGSDVSEVSPFLAGGHSRTLGEHTEFTGQLTPAWEYLDDRQRLRVTTEIGLALADRGVQTVILRDSFDREIARYQGGARLIPVPIPGR